MSASKSRCVERLIARSLAFELRRAMRPAGNVAATTSFRRSNDAVCAIASEISRRRLPIGHYAEFHCSHEVTPRAISRPEAVGRVFEASSRR